MVKFVLLGFIACLGACAIGPSNENWKKVNEFGLDPLLISYSFDETAGQEISDASVYVNTGKLVGATRAASKSASGLVFAGGGYAEIPPLLKSVTSSGQMSLMCWVRVPSISNSKQLLITEGHNFLSGGNSAGLELYIEAGIVKFRFNSVILGSATLALTAGQWQQIGFSSDGASLTLFLNGAANAVAATPGFIFGDPGQAKAFLGAANGFGSFFVGELDELRIYKIAQPASTFLEHYNSFK